MDRPKGPTYDETFQDIYHPDAFLWNGNEKSGIIRVIRSQNIDNTLFVRWYNVESALADKYDMQLSNEVLYELMHVSKYRKYFFGELPQQFKNKYRGDE